jgi:hypothetical protein
MRAPPPKTSGGLPTERDLPSPVACLESWVYSFTTLPASSHQLEILQLATGILLLPGHW